MRKASIGFLIAALVAFTLLFDVGSGQQTPQNEMVGYINSYRAQNGLGPLNESCILDISAQAKTDDMENQGYFDHYSPNGWTAVDWEASFGYPISDLWGVENILWSGASVADAFNVWVNSPPHRAQILSPYYTEVGVGLSNGPSYWGMYVLHFGNGSTASCGESAQKTATSAPIPVVDDITTSARLNVRSAPSLTASILGVIPVDAPVTLLDGLKSADGHIWVKVQTPKLTGWVASEYLAGFVSIGYGEDVEEPVIDIGEPPASPVAIGNGSQ